MQTGYRFRCYPTREQEQTLLKWIGCQRFIYNAKVREDRYFRTFQRQALALTGEPVPIDQQYAHFIGEDTAWLREVPSVILRNGAVRFKQAYGRFFSRLARRPTLQRKSGPQSVWLTSELFRFEPVVDGDTGEAAYRLHVGTKRFPVGELRYTAHRAHAVPASIHLMVDAGHWYLSFNCDDGLPVPDERETAAWLAALPEEELLERTVGADRGVAIPLCASTGQDFDLTPEQRQRIEKQRRAAARWQRKLVRRTQGGANWNKARRRLAACRRYERDVRRDFAHQTSHALVADPKTRLIVFEALGVKGMTARPKAKQDGEGRFLPNRAAQKAGLNQVILDSAWGRTKTYTQYKALRAGKLAIDVPAAHTSQECAECGHTHPDNRPSQAEFVCQRCGHSDHADRNAAKVIARRGVALIRSGGYAPKGKTRTMRLRAKGSTVGAGRSERDGESRRTPAETTVSRRAGNGAALGSGTQETPTSTRVAG